MFLLHSAGFLERDEARGASGHDEAGGIRDVENELYWAGTGARQEGYIGLPERRRLIKSRIRTISPRSISSMGLKSFKAGTAVSIQVAM